MSRLSLFLGLVALGLVGGGCKARPADEDHTPHTSAEGEPHDDGDAHDDHDTVDDRVRLDERMLRDLRVTTRLAESRAAGATVTALGELRVNETAYAEIGAPIQARISQLLASVGDLVEAGAPLAGLESPEIGSARAAHQKAGARLALAEQEVERRRPLAADRIVPARELEKAEAELARARAEVGAARSALASMGASGGGGAGFTLASPVAGTVIQRDVALGRRVDPSATLFVVADLGRLWLVVHAFERDALRIREGAVAEVEFAALPGRRWSGEVTFIGRQVDPVSRAVDVRIEIENPSGVLRPGMSATARLGLDDDAGEVVSVPIEALQRHPDGWCVFVPTGEAGVFERRRVGRGRDLGGEVEVLAGLTAGEAVVVDGAFLLKAEADKAQGGGDHHHH